MKSVKHHGRTSRYYTSLKIIIFLYYKIHFKSDIQINEQIKFYLYAKNKEI